MTIPSRHPGLAYWALAAQQYEPERRGDHNKQQLGGHQAWEAKQTHVDQRRDAPRKLGRGIRTADRRLVLLLMAGLFTVSDALSAAAPNFATMLLARFLLGAGIGGFWAIGGGPHAIIWTHADEVNQALLQFIG